MTKTAFKHWRTEEADISQKKAAEVLGCSVSYVSSLDAGVSRTTGQVITPSVPMRKLMTAYIQCEKAVFDPYPLTNFTKT